MDKIDAAANVDNLTDALRSRRNALSLIGGGVVGASLLPLSAASAKSASEATTPKPAFELFKGKEMYSEFANVRKLTAVRRMAPSSQPHKLEEGTKITLPSSYVHQGETRDLPKLLADTRTGALLVLKAGRVVYENYTLTGGRDVQWISFSVAKSFTSAMIGIALAESKITSLNDPVDKYLPWLSAGGYAGVPIIDLLHMSSGVNYSEAYEDAANPTSAVARGAVANAAGKSKEFVASLPRKWQPGTFCNYNSNDTLVLGWLLAAATGKTMTQYMQEKLCEPLGMEYPGYWITTNAGEYAAGGLNLAVRDYAKFGELYRSGGLWGDRQIVPADYVAASLSIEAPQCAPGQVTVGNHKIAMGYGRQWWIPKPGTDFSAIGIYNQYIYVHPESKVVIVKSSANPRYGLSPSDSDNKDEETLSALRTIAQATM